MAEHIAKLKGKRNVYRRHMKNIEDELLLLIDADFDEEGIIKLESK